MFLLKLLSILFMSCVPFLFTLDGDFVFDDSEAIVKNKDVTSNHWSKAFDNDFWGNDIASNLSHKSYRPLTILSFKLNYVLSGYQLNATHFKITNLICHMICCILLWCTLEAIVHSAELKSHTDCAVDVPYLATLLFSSHPVHVEAVSGIVGRADILSGIVFFLSLWSYKMSMTIRCYKLWLLLTTGLATISMLFKESGITVLGVVIIWELVVKIRSYNIVNGTFTLTGKERLLCKKPLIRIVSTILNLIVILIVRLIVQGGCKPMFKQTDNPAFFLNNVFQVVLNYSYIYFINAVILVWPAWLCYDWSMGCIPLLDFKDPRGFAIAITDFYGYSVMKAMFDEEMSGLSKRILIMATVLIIIPFIPASNLFFPVGFVIAERILYIPSAGYCLLICLGVNKLADRGTDKCRKITMGLFFFLVAINGLRSWQRSRDWQSEYNLFINGLAVCPLNAKVHYNVAKVADAKANTEWAIAEYKEAIRLYPEYYQAMNNLANLLKSQKKYTEAEFYLRNAIAKKRDFPAAWMNLGITLASVGRYNESQKAYKTALHFRKNYIDCFYNLGNLYLEMNKTEDAMAYWLKAIRLRSTHALAWTNLLALLDNTGKIDVAKKLIPKALKALPDSPSVCFAIANIYGKINHYEDAENYFKKALKLFGVNAQAIHYANLGVLYHRWKKIPLAEEMYKKALTIDPEFTSAQKNLISLKKSIST